MAPVRAVTFLAALALFASTKATTWTGGSSGSWSDPSNWDSGVPTASLTAVISTPNAVVNVQNFVTVGTVFINSTSTVLFLSGASIGSLQIRYGVADFRANANIGMITLSQASQLKIATGVVVNVTSSFDWNGESSTVGVSGSAGGVLNLLSNCTGRISEKEASKAIHGVTLSNYGTLVYAPTASDANSGLFLGSGASIVNNADGIMFVVCFSFSDSVISTDVPATSFINRGTLNVQVFPGTYFVVFANLENNGTINVLSGGLKFSSTASAGHDGTFNYQAGSYIQFAAGTHTLRAPSLVAFGNGIIFNGSITTILGSFLPMQFQQLSGTTRFGISYKNTGLVNIQGGILEFFANSTLTDLEIFDDAALYITGASVTLQINRTFTWSGNNAEISSALPAGSLLLPTTCKTVITGTGRIEAVRVTNNGNLTYSPPATFDVAIGLTLAQNASFINSATGIFAVNSSLPSDVNLLADLPTARITNNGRFTVAIDPARDLNTYLILENAAGGIVQVLTGSLRYMNTESVSHNGRFTVNGTSTIEFKAGTHTLTRTSVVDLTRGIIFDGATTLVNCSSFLPPTITQLSGITTFYIAYNPTEAVTVAGGTLDIRVSSAFVNLTLQGQSSALLISGSAIVLTVSNTFVWTGTDTRIAATGVPGALTLAATCRSSFLAAGSNQMLEVTLNNNGRMAYSPIDDGTKIGTSGAFNNLATGVMNVTSQDGNNVKMTTTNNTKVFTNAASGQISVSLPVDVSFVMEATFINSGIFTVVSGSFDLFTSAAATHTGTFTHSPGAYFKFLAGSHTFSSTAIVNNGTGIIFDGAVTTISTANFKPYTFGMLSGTTIFTVAYTTTGPITINGGILDFRAATTITTLTLTGTGSSLYATTAAGIVSINGQFVWNGTDCKIGSGTSVGGRVQISTVTARGQIIGVGDDQTISYSTFWNYGILQYSPSSVNGIQLINGASFQNAAGGTFNVTSDSSDIFFTSANDALNFINNGTMLVSIPTAASFVMSSRFTNNLNLTVVSGTLEFTNTNAATHIGSFAHNSPNAFIKFTTGTHTFAAGSRVLAGNGLIFNGSTVSFAGSFVAPSFLVLSGSVTFSSTINAVGTITITGGILDFKINSVVGTIILNGTSTLSVSVATANLNVTSSFIWTGFNSILSTTTAAGGIINLHSSCTSSMTGDGTSQNIRLVTLNNYGSLEYRSAGNGINLNAGFFANRGVMNVTKQPSNVIFSSSSATSTFENYGTLYVDVGSSLSFQVYANFNNRGLLRILTGSVLISSNGTHTGNFTFGEDTNIQIMTGVQTFSATAVVNGGYVIFYGGATTVAGTFRGTRMDVIGASVTVSAALLLNICTVRIYSGTLAFSSTSSMSISSVVASGGTTTFSGATTTLDQLLLSSSAVVRVQRQACINDLVIQDAANLQIDSIGKINVYTSFRWTGTSTASVTSPSNVVGGLLNLMGNCTSVLDGSSNDHALQYLALHNFGLVKFSALNLSLRNGATLVNHVGATFNVTTAAQNAQIGATANPSTHYFDNYGTVSLHTNSPNTFTSVVSVRNYGVFSFGTSQMSVTSPSTVTQFLGNTILSGGTWTTPFYYFRGGFIDGFGSIAGLVQHIGGIVRPGGRNEVGQLLFGGYSSNTTSALVEIEARGTSEFDSLKVLGTAQSPSRIIFIPLSPYVPAVDNIFNGVISGNPLSGLTTVASTSATITTSYNLPNNITLRISSLATTTTCTSNCSSNGACVSSNVCQCWDGWTGTNCSTFACSTACANGGTCIGPNTCNCVNGYSGQFCQVLPATGCFNVTAGSTKLQSGCTDPTAINYNPTAYCDDGSCVYFCNASLCITPPENYCTNSVLHAYNVPGFCAVDGTCNYSVNVTDCSLIGARCVNGGCAFDVTTSPLTTSPLTSRYLSTSPLTTVAATTGAITSGSVTSGAITSGALTTSPLTTGSVLTRTTRWIGGSGNWFDASNWDNSVPLFNSIVIVSANNANITASLSVNFETLIINGTSSVNFGSAASIQNVSVSRGVVQFQAATNIVHLLLLANSGLSVGSSGQVNVSSNFDWSGVSSQINGDSNTAKLNLLSSCSSRISGVDASKGISGITLTNYGYLQHAPSVQNPSTGLSMSNGATLTNGIGGTFFVTSFSFMDSTFSSPDTSPLLINSGTMNVQVYPNTYLQLFVPFKNDGTLNVLSGGIRFRSTSAVQNHTGIFNHLSGTFIQFSSGTHTLASSSIINDGIGIVFNGSTTQLYGVFKPMSFQLLSGTTRFFIPYNNTGTVNLQGGILDFRVNGSRLTNLILGDNTRLYVTNSVTLNINLTLVWNGINSRISSATTTYGTVILSATCQTTITGTGAIFSTVINNGLITYSPPSSNLTQVGIIFSTYGTLVNAATGIINVTSSLDSEINLLSTNVINSRITNSGRFVLSISMEQPLNIYVCFENAGTVQVLSGRIKFMNAEPATHGGRFTISSTNPSARIEFLAGTHNLVRTSIIDVTRGFVFNGANTLINSTTVSLPTFQQISGNTTFFVAYAANETVTIVGGTIDFRAAATFVNLTLNGTETSLRVSASATITVSNTFVWMGTDNKIGYSVTPVGSFNLATTSRSNIIGSGNNQILSVPFNNNGRLTYSPLDDGIKLDVNGAFSNLVAAATFNVTSQGGDVKMTATNNTLKFTNVGQFTVGLGSSQTLVIDSNFINNGIMTVTSGSVAFTNTFTTTHNGTFTHSPGAYFKFLAGSHTFSSIAIVNNGTGIIFDGAITTISTANFKPYTFGMLSGTTIFTVAYTTTGPITINGGILDFRAATTITTLTLTGTGSSLYATTAAGIVSINGQFVWNGTDCKIGSGTSVGGRVQISTVTARGQIIGTGDDQTISYSTFWNYGILQYSPSSVNGIQLINGASFQNAAGGTFNVTSDSSDIFFTSANDALNFVNNGTMLVSIPTTASFVMSSRFTNNLNLTVVSGTLEFTNTNTATHIGSFAHNSPNAFIKFTTGTHTFAAGSRVLAGNGLIFNGSTVSFAGSFVAPSFLVLSGSVTFSSTINAVGTITIMGGILDFKINSVVGTIILNGTSTLSVSVATANLNVTTSFIWTGFNSILSTTTAVGGVINLQSTCSSSIAGDGTSQFVSVVKVNNYGNMTYLAIGNGVNLQTTTFTNIGTMTIARQTTAVVFTATSTASTFVNTGILDVNVGQANQFLVFSPFNNNGRLVISSGTLVLNAAGTHSGSFNFTRYSTLQVLSGVHTFATSTVVNGGFVQFVGGSTTFSGSLRNTRFDVTGATVTIPSTTLVNICSINVYAGALNFTGTTAAMSVSSLSALGGTAMFYGNMTIDDLQMSSAGVVVVKKQVCVNNLLLSDAANLQIDSTAKVNVFQTFRWTGSSSATILTTNAVATTAQFNVMNNCTATFDGSSSLQYLQYVSLNNFGKVVYKPQAGGIQLRDGATWVNHRGSVMNVSTNGGDVLLGVFANPSLHTLDNYGTINVQTSSTFNARIFPNIRNYGDFFVGTSNIVMPSPANYTQFYGTTTFSSPSSLTVGTFTLRGGFLDGTGSIVGAVSHQTGGSIRPGGLNQIGRFTFTTYSSSGNTVVEIEATGVSDFDSIRATSTSAVPNTLVFSPLSPFTPAVGNTLNGVLSGNAISGLINNVASTSITVTTNYYFPSNVTLRVSSLSPSVTCSNNCSGNGNCVGPGSNVCQCWSGWNGTTCAAFVCTTACANGGTCTGPNTCSCVNGYTGPTCNVLPATGCFSSSSSVILNTGCTDPTAENYNPDAVCDDGSCIYPCVPSECLDVPADYCYNGTVLYSYPEHGTCNANGTDCLYLPNRVDCGLTGMKCFGAHCVALTTGAVTSGALTTSPLTSGALTTSPLTTSPITSGQITTYFITTEENLSSDDLTTQDMTTAPLTSGSLTTQELTTSPLTTSPLTTQEMTTLPLTTQEMTTLPLTTQELTTSPLTTRELTTSPLTTRELTTLPLTTKEMTTSPLTTSPLTTKEMTTSPLTTQPLTTLPFSTGQLTTAPLTTSPLTTAQLTTSHLTTSALTTKELTTSPLTTNGLTTAALTTKELTTSPLTTNELTTSPLTTNELTTSPLTTNDLTTSPLTTNELTTSPLTTESEDVSSGATTSEELTTQALTSSALTTSVEPEVTTSHVTTAISLTTAELTTGSEATLTTSAVTTSRAATTRSVTTRAITTGNGKVMISIEMEGDPSTFDEVAFMTLVCSVVPECDRLTLVNIRRGSVITDITVDESSVSGASTVTQIVMSVVNTFYDPVWTGQNDIEVIDIQVTGLATTGGVPSNPTTGQNVPTSSSDGTTENVVTTGDDSTGEGGGSSKIIIIVVVVVVVALIAGIVIALLIVRKRRSTSNNSTTRQAEESPDRETGNDIQLQNYATFNSDGTVKDRKQEKKSRRDLETESESEDEGQRYGKIKKVEEKESKKEEFDSHYSSSASSSNSSRSGDKYKPVPGRKTLSLIESTSTSRGDLSSVTNSVIIKKQEIKFGRKIGSGAYGDVIEGQWRGTQVAIKEMRKFEGISETALKEFEHEAYLMSVMRNHDNIVSFFGICLEPLCIITAYCEGGSLDSLLRSNSKISRKTLKKVVTGITAGMMHLHYEKIIHRDLAPRNVLLGAGDVAKISDFGLSRVSTSVENKTSSDTGPIRHMAPESLLESSYSYKSDVWSFGITLWECFERKEPYSERSILEVASRVVQPENPLRLLPSERMSQPMKQLFLSCIATDPKDRPTFIDIQEKLVEMESFFASRNEDI